MTAMKPQTNIRREIEPYETFRKKNEQKRNNRITCDTL